MQEEYFFTLNEMQEIENLNLMIIGGAGYIGSFVSQLLVPHQIKKLICIDDFSEDDGNIRRIYSLLNKDNFDNYKLNITNSDDIKQLEDIVENEEIDVILYLANNKSSYSLTQEPTLISEELKKFTICLELAKTWCRKFVFASSKFVNPPLNKKVNFPIDLKGVLDKSCELLAQSYSQLYDLEVVCLRYFDLFGPDQRYKLKVGEDESELHPIPKIIMSILRDKDIELPTKNIMYDLCYIEDCAVATVKGIINGKNGEVYDITDDFVIDLNMLVQIILKFISKKYIGKINYEEDEECLFKQFIYDKANLDKTMDEINYIPSIYFDDALMKTIHYYYTVYEYNNAIEIKKEDNYLSEEDGSVDCGV